MSDQNVNMTDTLVELNKLIELMEEDADNLTPAQAIGDYIAPILASMLAEIEANRQYLLQVGDRANLAIMMSEKTFLGEILTNIADHFSTIVSEIPEDLEEDSKMGIAVTEIQDLLATWMSFEADDGEGEDEEEDDSEQNEASMSESDEVEVEVVDNASVTPTEDTEVENGES